MNKKGFTLVEIIIVIVLIALMAVIVIPNLAKGDVETKQQLYDSKVKSSLAAAYKYGKENIDSLSNDGSCTYITIGDLIEKGYITPDDEEGTYLVNPITNESMNDVTICVKYTDREVVTSVK